MLRKPGANFIGKHHCEFVVWAPFRKKVQLELRDKEKAIDLDHDDDGYWYADLENITPGTQYRFILNGELERPDPASRFQPEGVHSWSEVVADDYVWNDSDWEGLALKSMIIYELHTGTFSEEGTFEGIGHKLDYLLSLGINAIEIMPIAQFPGNRNWGYDGVYPYAPQNSYGGPDGLKALVDLCHRKGIAVILDVVYNHMGPEGNYLSDYGPYFTDKYNTPWGAALNFDDAYSDHVRTFFMGSALMWLDEYHIDGLRLDAIHAIIDHSSRHFLKDLRQIVDELETRSWRKYHLIAESDLNDVQVINPYDRGGYGLDAQWVDDFHHAVHTLATGEKTGYYEDFGKVEHLAKAFRQGMVYDGIYSPFRKKTVGSNPRLQPPCKFVVCVQNHDQTGNRMLGERLPQIVSFEMLKLVAGTLLIAPYIPMLFMGEEHGEDHPFLYFVSHGDKDLVKAVREGRAKEFEYFKWKGEVPDPQSEDTFLSSRINWEYKNNVQSNTLFSWYQYLIRLRKDGVFDAFAERHLDMEVHEKEKLLVIRSRNKKGGKPPLLAILNFSDQPHAVPVPGSSRQWQKILASSDQQWLGPDDNSSINILEKGDSIKITPESLTLYEAKL